MTIVWWFIFMNWSSTFQMIFNRILFWNFFRPWKGYDETGCCGCWSHFPGVWATDFRQPIPGLVASVTLQFQMDPHNGNYVFIFCNRKRDAIKVLRYDRNGFVLATKKLLDDMKFQWPRTPNEVKEISFQQVEWLLQGLEIEQKKA